MNDLSPASVSVAQFSASPSPTVPAEIQALLGPPPVYYGESAEDYQSSFLCLADALKPQDAVDWIHVKDIADANWESRRMQHYIAAIIKDGIPFAARSTLGRSLARATGNPEIMGATAPEERWIEKQATLAVLRPRSGRRLYKKVLKDSNFTEAEVAAHSYANRFDLISQIEDNKARCDARKTRLLRDYERLQTVKGRPASRARSDVVDLPFKTGT